MEKTVVRAYWAVVGVAFLTIMLIMAFAMPAKAHAAETSSTTLKAATVLTTQSTKAATTKAKASNPYIDVISGKTVDKTGYNAIKYVKAHKGYNKVITGKRFYPNKTFTEAQYTKILRNLYGNKVALSKSKKVVTAKYACDQLTKVAKNCFGVKIKWKAGNGSAKLTRTGTSNYVKTFATWQNGLFTPRQ